MPWRTLAVRVRFLWHVFIGVASISASEAAVSRPNILLCIADDASAAHFGANGDRVSRTPVFDRLARAGVNFRHAFCSASSCTPSRGALLTGQDFWRLEEGGNLWSRWPNRPDKFPLYTDLLEKAGYHIGLKGKGWGPGDFQTGGREKNPAGTQYRDFATFLKSVPSGKPFCFWFGSQDPHRPYERGSGIKSGHDPADVQVPSFLPDNLAVRSDLLDYYYEIERFDRETGEILKQLEEAGQLENTLIVMTSDNGFPFPRGKATCYDAGTRMPLAICWPARVPGNRTIDDFVNLTDLAPTFLEAAGAPIPHAVTGRSLLPLLLIEKSGQLDPTRDRVVVGRERHASVREGNVGYPSRALRTRDYLYIRNFRPERWPAGDPPLYGDVDEHLSIKGSPSKEAVIENDGSAAGKLLFDLAFGKRPAEELYDLRSDPWQTNNLAREPSIQTTRANLQTALETYLLKTGDPRANANEDIFDQYYYVTGQPRSKAKKP